MYIKYYLKQNVMAEPLYNQWYSWSHLIAPHTAAMNIANSHLKIMKSYVAAPQVHANALKNPAMIGGPFIDYQGRRADEIKALLDRTTKEQAHLIRLAESIKILDEKLRNEAKGHSLESMYASVPENLRGYVELVYDLNNNPAIRFFERMLYKSEYYDPNLQSLALSLIFEDNRPFVLSTPRLFDKNVVQINVPYSHEAVDILFNMKYAPRPFGYIKEHLKLAPEQEETFKTFLTETSPPEHQRYRGDGIRVRYFGHACVMLETIDVSLIIDPVISYSYENGIDRFTFEDLPDVIDYVIITHGHQDHVMFETLLQLRHKIKNVIVPKNRGKCLQDPSLKLALQHVGFNNVLEIEEMETLKIEGGIITGLPFLGEHCDLDIGTKLAHLIRLKDTSFLFAADSNNIEPYLYERLFKLIGEIDVLYLGMECDGAPMTWLYGPLLTKPLERKMDQSRRFSGSNSERGMGIVNRFNCKEVYVYAMGQEPWLTYALSIKYTDESNPIVQSNMLVEECRKRGIESERLYGKKERIY